MHPKKHLVLRRNLNIAALLLLLICTSIWAQSSASFEISQAEMNFGGRPGSASGAGSSASFELSLEAIGGNAIGTNLSSKSFSFSGGFGSANAPPGNVSELLWSTKTDLIWSAGSSAVSYNLYRDNINTLSTLGYGNCLSDDIPNLSEQDFDTPSSGESFFYLVSANNRLNEESSKGLDSSGASRHGTVCP